MQVILSQCESQLVSRRVNVEEEMRMPRSIRRDQFEMNINIYNELDSNSSFIQPFGRMPFGDEGNV